MASAGLSSRQRTDGRSQSQSMATAADWPVADRSRKRSAHSHSVLGRPPSSKTSVKVHHDRMSTTPARAGMVRKANAAAAEVSWPR